METGKTWDLSTKLDFESEFASEIARKALETRLLSELEEKDETLFTGADATIHLWAHGEKKDESFA